MIFRRISSPTVYIKMFRSTSFPSQPLSFPSRPIILTIPTTYPYHPNHLSFPSQPLILPIPATYPSHPNHLSFPSQPFILSIPTTYPFHPNHLSFPSQPLILPIPATYPSHPNNLSFPSQPLIPSIPTTYPSLTNHLQYTPYPLSDCCYNNYYNYWLMLNICNRRNGKCINIKQTISGAKFGSGSVLEFSQKESESAYTRQAISGRQTLGLTRGLPHICYIYCIKGG
jgi:hypothetical protein